MIYSEDKHVNTLIDKAKTKAKSIHLANKQVKNVDDLIWTLKVWWCQFHKRPLKDPLLESYDLNELLLEFFLLTEVDETQETNTMISENKEELFDLFKDMESKPEVSPDEKEFLEKEWSMTEKDFQ